MKQQKVCSKCNENLNLSEFYYHRTRKYYMSSCKKCNSRCCLDRQRVRRKEKEINFLLGARANEIRRRCKHKNIEVATNLKEILVEAWITQEGCCFYTQEPIFFDGYHDNLPSAVTVDRLNPNIGYVLGNVVLASAKVNRSKQDMTVSEFREFCKNMLSCLDNLVLPQPQVPATLRR